MKSIILFFLSIFFAGYSFTQSLVVYPPPAQNFNKTSDKYIVNVSQNGVTKSSLVYKSTAGTGTQREWGQEQNNNFNFTTFSFSRPITVEVIKLNSTATSATIRPNRLGIGVIRTAPANGGKKVTFNLRNPSKVSVEFNDDPEFKDVLVIFADSLENSIDVPGNNAGNIYYVKNSEDLKNIPSYKTIVFFKPGIYKMGYWDIPANIRQVYISGGAYIMGYLNRESAASVKINGRGILSGDGYPYHYPSATTTQDDYKTWYALINIKRGQNHMVEGIILLNATGVNLHVVANNVIIKNIKINGFRLNNDGITIGGTGGKIVNCFFRVNDDAIVPYGSNITISNCVFWQLQGSVLQLGWTPHSMENISATHCDVIHDKALNTEGNVGFINAMNYSQATEYAVIKNVNISDINFDTPILRFLDIRGDRSYSLKGYKSAAAQLPWVYKDFHFSNIHFIQSSNRPIIYLHGYNDAHPSTNFTFENIYNNNIKVSKDKASNSFFINMKSMNTIQIK